MIIDLLKQKKILQNNIARKRLNKANFAIHNVNSRHFDFICCIPINGFNSGLIHEIRVFLKMYGYNPSQYTTKAFLLKMTKNNLNIDKTNLSLFYIGQMLVFTVDLGLSSFSTMPKQRIIIEKFFFNFIYTSLNNIPFCNLIYIRNNYLVCNRISTKFLQSLPNYFNNNLSFVNIYSVILNLLQLFVLHIVNNINLLKYLSSNSKLVVKTENKNKNEQNL